MVSVEFCVQQRIVVVGEVLAACFAGFFASFSIFSSWGIMFDLLSKTLELHEQCTVLLLIEFRDYNFPFFINTT